MVYEPLSAFSLDFSSAGKGPFIAGKAINMCTLSWGGVVEWRTWLPPRCEIKELSSLKHHSPSFEVLFHANQPLLSQFKTFDSNNCTLSSNALFPKCVAHKKKACVYFSTLPCIHSLPWSDWITTYVFFKTTYSILVNLTAVAGGKKCYFRQSILPVTAW